MSGQLEPYRAVLCLGTNSELEHWEVQALRKLLWFRWWEPQKVYATEAEAQQALQSIRHGVIYAKDPAEARGAA